MATDLMLARIVQVGAMPIATYAVLAGLMSTWNRSDATDFVLVMVDHIVPPYPARMDCYDKGQRVQGEGRETNLEFMGRPYEEVRTAAEICAFPVMQTKRP